MNLKKLNEWVDKFAPYGYNFNDDGFISVTSNYMAFVVRDGSADELKAIENKSAARIVKVNINRQVQEFERREIVRVEAPENLKVKLSECPYVEKSDITKIPVIKIGEALYDVRLIKKAVAIIGAKNAVLYQERTNISPLLIYENEMYNNCAFIMPINPKCEVRQR